VYRTRAPELAATTAGLDKISQKYSFCRYFAQELYQGTDFGDFLPELPGVDCFGIFFNFLFFVFCQRSLVLMALAWGRMVWTAIARKLRPSCWCEYVCDGLLLLCDGLDGDSKEIEALMLV
jgi:hypothetical protein